MFTIWARSPVVMKLDGIFFLREQKGYTWTLLLWHQFFLSKMQFFLRSPVLPIDSWIPPRYLKPEYSVGYCSLNFDATSCKKYYMHSLCYMIITAMHL